MPLPHHHVIRCPECGGYMEEGAVSVTTGLHWLRSRKTEHRDLSESLPGTHAVMRTNRLIAWRCRGCQLVLMRYGQPLEHQPDDREDHEIAAAQDTAEQD